MPPKKALTLEEEQAESTGRIELLNEQIELTELYWSQLSLLNEVMICGFTFEIPSDVFAGGIGVVYSSVFRPFDELTLVHCIEGQISVSNKSYINDDDTVFSFRTRENENEIGRITAAYQTQANAILSTDYPVIRLRELGESLESFLNRVASSDHDTDWNQILTNE